MSASLKWRVYGLIRPIVRPPMRRLRLFLVGRLHDELAELRAEVSGLRLLIERRQCLEPETVQVLVDQRSREIMAQALATLALDRDYSAQGDDGLPFST